MGAVVGIDLGTTNTVVAAIKDGHPVALPDESGSTLIPSIVSFLPSGAVLVGNTAKERRSQDPRNTIYSVKRLIGRTWDSPEVQTALKRFPFEMNEGPGRATFVVARGETYTLPEISAFVLRKAKSIAELELGESVDRAVITVPANFNDLQRAATKVAGRVAGLEVLRILNEPTAAALAFGHTRGNRERIAVYDFGGGTFDLTLLLLTDDVFEVLATAGDTFLGGDDIDASIVQRMARRLESTLLADPQTGSETLERLRAAAEHVKLSLSEAPDTRISLADHEIASSTSLEFSMTRDELDALVDPIVARTFHVCHDALSMAKLSPRDIDHVLLVGGTTRIPLVRQRVEEYFGRRARADLDPHEVVALGAAQQAMALTQLRATASGIPVAPPRRPAIGSSTNESVDKQALRKQTDPGVGDGEPVQPGRVSVVPPELPVSQATPTTQNFGSRDRRITGVGLGPSEPDLPAISPASMTSTQRTAVTVPPNTISGLGLSEERSVTPLVVRQVSPVTPPTEAPLETEAARPRAFGQVGVAASDFAREPMVRVAGGTGVSKDLPAAVEPSDARPASAPTSKDSPRTDPQFASAALELSRHHDTPLPKTAPQFDDLPARAERPQLTPAQTTTSRLGVPPARGERGQAASAPGTDPQFRGAALSNASVSGVEQPETDPLFGALVQPRSTTEGPDAPTTNPIFGTSTGTGAAGPAASATPGAPNSRGRQTLASRETIPDDVGSWGQPAFDAGTDVGLPVVTSASRGTADRRAATQVSADRPRGAVPQRPAAAASTVDLLADLPLVVPSSAPQNAGVVGSDETKRGSPQSPTVKFHAATKSAISPDLVKTQDSAQPPLGLPEPDVARTQNSAQDRPGLPEPELSDAIDGDDGNADEPTIIRRPAKSLLDWSDSSPDLGARTLEDELDVPALSSGKRSTARASATDELSPASPRHTGRPSSLNEEEIRARYGNLPLIVGGRRVGTQGPESAATSTAGATTRPASGQGAAPDLSAASVRSPIAPGDSKAASAAVRAKPATAPTAGGTGKPAQQGLVTPHQGEIVAKSPTQDPFSARGVTDPGTRRPNPPASTTTLPPLPLPPIAPPIPLLEPEEVETSEIDLAPVLPHQRRPDPPQRVPAAPLPAEDLGTKKPRLHSTRPSARQSAIEELELPVPDLPLSQPASPIPDGRTDAIAAAPPPRQAPPPQRAPVLAHQTAPERSAPLPKPQTAATAPIKTSSETGRGLNLESALPPASRGIPTGPWQPPGLLASGSETQPLSPIPQAPTVEVPPLLASIPRVATAQPALLIDVTPLSLCVETVGGYVDVLVGRNTPVPCERTRDFITAHDNQQAVIVRVAQGESKSFHENVLLGEVQLTGIPAAPRGQSRIAVTFGIDSDGILHVRALDVGSGQSALVDLKLTGAPTSPEIAQMMARHRAKGQA